MTNDDDSRAGAFWERHNKIMQDPEHEARFAAELARIRAVDAEVNANDDTLRTALTKLAEDWPGGFGEELRALFAAHSAPETKHRHDWVHKEHLPGGFNRYRCSCGAEEVEPATVSDSRREDVGALNIVFDGPPASESGRFVEVETDDGASVRVGEWIDRGDGTWALRLPAPPVVDEATETVVEYLLLGHPAWPGNLATRDEESAARFLAEHQEDIPGIWVERRVTTRQPWTAHLRGATR